MRLCSASTWLVDGFKAQPRVSQTESRMSPGDPGAATSGRTWDCHGHHEAAGDLPAQELIEAGAVGGEVSS